MGITVVSWNIAKRHQSWRQLRRMDADVALLQEGMPPQESVVREDARPLDIGPRDAWDSHSWNSDWWRQRGRALFERWPMVVRLSDRVDVEWFKQVGPAGWMEQDEVDVSGIGTIAVARVTRRDGSIEPFIAVSMYGRWMPTHPSENRPSLLYTDASAHRIISDLSAFIGHENPRMHRILAAGDLNFPYGYAEAMPEEARTYWAGRYATVFDRMEALGLPFVGPQFPHGRQADPWPDELPRESMNVPTYSPKKDPASAIRQLDFVFASRGFHESVRVRAMNGVEEWGPSDHCRILIEVEG